MKWRKYLRLVDYGLITREELEHTIFRYQIGRSEALRKDVEACLLEEEQSRGRSLYVLKLVPPDRQGQLPNLRVQSYRDLDELDNFIRRHSHVRASEIWYCRTPVGEDIFSVAGRILFAREELYESQIVEQVWRCSPRLIEAYGKPYFPFPYARASRISWGWRFNIDVIYSPAAEQATTQRSEFFSSLQTLERAREKIELFLSDLFEHANLRSASLEYKILGGHLSIIDWDTPNDRAVLDS